MRGTLMSVMGLVGVMAAVGGAGASAEEVRHVVDRNGERPKVVIAAMDHCAWPCLVQVPGAKGRAPTIAAMIFNDASHGHHPGDIECWLSGDGGATWKLASAVTQHEPETIRMNHAAGLTKSGELIVLTSGWSNRWPSDAVRTRGSYRYDVLGPWVSRSPDGGRSWWVDKSGFPQLTPAGRPGVPFGNVQIAANGDLCVSVYSDRQPLGKYEDRTFGSWLYRSRDDGKTWEAEPAVIGPESNETAVLHVGGGRWLASARMGNGVQQQDWIMVMASDDDGRTWKPTGHRTGRQQVTGSLTKLRDGRVLLCYGDRLPAPGSKGMFVEVSSDEGRTWSKPVRLADYNGLDGGYPSSVQPADRQVVTAYYASALPGDPPDGMKGYHMEVIVWDVDRTFRP